VRARVNRAAKYRAVPVLIVMESVFQINAVPPAVRHAQLKVSPEKTATPILISLRGDVSKYSSGAIDLSH